MKRNLSVLTSVLFALLLPASAGASSNRIFVSTTGNDANDCSNPLTPCLDFAGALSQVNAGGEIIAEATGPYGPLNITKAVTISGPPGVVIYSGHQVTINASSATVVLRGLTIDGTGAGENGINVVAVGVLHVESCVITGFTGSGAASGNGLFFGSSGELFAKDTIVRGNSWVGIWVSPSSGTARASIEHCRVEGNLSGVGCEPGAVATIRDSVISGSGGIALFVEGNATAEMNVESCMVSNNATGVQSNPGTIRLSNTTVTDNQTGLFASGGGSLLSRSNNTVEGNTTTNGSFTGTFSAK
jgi:hypothetical protein